MELNASVKEYFHNSVPFYNKFTKDGGEHQGHSTTLYWNNYLILFAYRLRNKHT